MVSARIPASNDIGLRWSLASDCGPERARNPAFRSLGFRILGDDRGMLRQYLPGPARRRLETVVADRLEEEPVIVLEGPRSVGKSTLLARVAASRGVEVIDLDDPSVQAAVRGNLNGFLATPPPVCIDEYQKVPELLDAIKARLNRSSRPGSIVLTGSTRYQALPLAAQSLTGRMHVITVRPLSQGEISGKRETCLLYTSDAADE